MDGARARLSAISPPPPRAPYTHTVGGESLPCASRRSVAVPALRARRSPRPRREESFGEGVAPERSRCRRNAAARSLPQRAVPRERERRGRRRARRPGSSRRRRRPSNARARARVREELEVRRRDSLAERRRVGVSSMPASVRSSRPARLKLSGGEVPAITSSVDQPPVEAEEGAEPAAASREAMTHDVPFSAAMAMYSGGAHGRASLAQQRREPITWSSRRRSRQVRRLAPDSGYGSRGRL